jgi:hypothetical protein
MGELSDDEVRERLQFHREYWLHVLTGCLGWSVKAANEWADKMLEGPPVVLHEKPGEWIVLFFVPDRARTWSPDKFNALCDRLLDAIDPSDVYDPSLPDCATISARVRQVLEQFQLNDFELPPPLPPE